MPCHDQCAPIALQLLVYGLTNGAVVALNAVGFTLAYGVARQINLAHGNVFALTTVLLASLAQILGVTALTPPLARLGAILLLIVAGALCGAALNSAVERLAFRPFLRPAHGARDPLTSLIATVALSFLMLQVALWWRMVVPAVDPLERRGHQGVNLPLLAMPDLLPAIQIGPDVVSFTLRDAFVLLLAAAVATAVAGLLTMTRTGRLLRAVAQDGELVALCGADPNRAQTLAFALAGALAGLGAAIFALYYGGTAEQHGLRSGLAAMTAAVLGGVGDPRGALLGGVTLGIAGSFSDYLLDSRWTPVLLLLLLVALLAYRPAGLLGSGRTDASAAALAPPPTVAARSSPGTRLALAALLALGLLYPWLDLLAGWHRLHSAASALLLVTLVLGLGIVVGFAGLLDLGYAAFFAIGGYTAALLTATGSRLALHLPEPAQNPWLALPLAGLVAAGFGFAFGLPSVRTRGEYLAIVTLAFGEIVPSLINHLADWTGGPRGVSGIPPLRLGPWAPGSPLHAYLVALSLAALAGLATIRLSGSRLGRAWTAVRDDEAAAAAVAVNPLVAKLLAFTIGAAYAGVAGAVAAGLAGYIEPGQFDFTLSLMVLAAVVIGGRWGIAGAVLGALLVAAYDRLLVDLLDEGLRALSAGLLAVDLREHNFAVFGLALYLATLLRARGDEDAPAPAPRLLPRAAPERSEP